jgi:hypothetical protein|tara:strand:- start:158 stop:1009 length:852 start_codon:yes stop_codon:yes gene_type:complete
MHTVGLFYSAQEFLSFVKKNTVIGDDFERIGKRFVLASPSEVFSVSLRCNWVQLDGKGKCILTFRGEEILDQTSTVLMLRNQLQDIIEVYQPPWAMKIRNGRSEVKRFLPEPTEQIFKEANLLAEWTDEIIEWWDIIAQQVRMQKSSEKLHVGRFAERLSFQYEQMRTGKKPHWQSIESNFSGFDILSVIATEDFRKVQIEVKGSELSLKEAGFFVTRNEWNTAKNSEFYRFHLWVLKGNTRLIELDSSDVQPHIPNNCGVGNWEQVRIPFSVFGEKAKEFKL